VIVVMDNLNFHTPASFYEEFPPERACLLATRRNWLSRSRIWAHRGLNLSANTRGYENRFVRAGVQDPPT